MKNIIVHSVSFWTQRKGKTKTFLWVPSLDELWTCGQKHWDYISNCFIPSDT